MKRYIVFLIILLLATVTIAQNPYPINSRTVGTTRQLVRTLNSRFDAIDDDLAAAGGLYNIGTGEIRYVDSGLSNATAIDGLTKTKAEPTLEAAFAQATNPLVAARGDVVYCMPGHTEDLTAANACDLDIADVTVVMLGKGDNEATFTYSQAAGEFVIGAANLTVYGGRYHPTTPDVLMAISVEAGGDNFTHINPHFPEPASVGDLFIDVYDLAAAAHDFRIYGAVYRCTSPTTGTETFIDAGNGVNQNMKIVECDIAGYFEVSAIYSDVVDEDALITRNHISNKTAGEHAIEFTAAATGFITYNSIYTNASPTSIDPGSMRTIQNFVADADDVTDGTSGGVHPALP